MTIFLLGIGGACGAIARFRLGALFLKHERMFPLGTFIINIIGALLLGIFCGLKLSGNPYILLGDGFCGAFTTFSTFMVESVLLMQEGATKKSIVYIILSVVMGLLCFFAGYVAGGLL